MKNASKNKRQRVKPITLPTKIPEKYTENEKEGKEKKETN